MVVYVLPILALIYIVWMIVVKTKERIDTIMKENAYLKERVAFTESILHKIVSVGSKESLN